MRINFKRYILYLLRWQAGTPILAGAGILLAGMGYIVAAIIANLIGGLIFFFSGPVHLHVPVACLPVGSQGKYPVRGCGKIARGYRLVRSGNYDKSGDKVPEFRCEECSRKKSEALKNKGVRVE
ncbi:MAG: hypothetical protein WC342_00770 [Methanoregula sp.]|jgi:hypothetical protein